MMESEGSIAGKEVRGLPDSVGECNMYVIVIFFKCGFFPLFFSHIQFKQSTKILYAGPNLLLLFFLFIWT